MSPAAIHTAVVLSFLLHGRAERQWNSMGGEEEEEDKTFFALRIIST